MKGNRIILRADGNSIIGMGHFYRALALGEMLKDEFYTIYATRIPSENQLAEMKNICQEIITLPDDNSHFDMFLDFLQSTDIVILDNYYFSAEYQSRILNIGCKLICVDDIHDKHYVSHIVINHAQGIDRNKFSVEKYTSLLLGLDYAVLRKPFFSLPAKLPKLFDILIGIGGSDPNDISFKLMTELKSRFPELVLAIILGNAYNGYININNEEIKVFRNLSSSELNHLMRISEIGIFPASTMAIEGIASGIPFVSGYFVDNQKEIYNSLVENNLALGIGNFNILDKESFDMISLLYRDKELQMKIKDQQNKKFDRNSPRRIIQAINNLQNIN